MNEKAVEVAKDVLKHLKFLTLCDNCYVEMKDGKEGLLEELNGSLQKHVDRVQKHCRVCLLGACVLSKARIDNRIAVEDFSMLKKKANPIEMRATLSDVFDRTTMDLMEVAFEKMSFSWTEGAEDQIEAAIRFGKQYESLPDRVEAVMKKIIEGGGVLLF